MREVVQLREGVETGETDLLSRPAARKSWDEQAYHNHDDLFSYLLK